MSIRLLTVLLALPLLAACGSEVAAPAPAGRDDGDGPTGEYLTDGLSDPFGEGDSLRVTFGDGEISFRATCNTLSGAAHIEDGVLVVSNVGGTEIGCHGAGHEQDQWLVDFFSSRPSLTVDGTDVQLARGEAEIWLVQADEGAPDPGPDARSREPTGDRPASRRPTVT